MIKDIKKSSKTAEGIGYQFTVNFSRHNSRDSCVDEKIYGGWREVRSVQPGYGILVSYLTYIPNWEQSYVSLSIEAGPRRGRDNYRLSDSGAEIIGRIEGETWTYISRGFLRSVRFRPPAGRCLTIHDNVTGPDSIGASSQQCAPPDAYVHDTFLPRFSLTVPPLYRDRTKSYGNI